jgi:hypothetical protein
LISKELQALQADVRAAGGNFEVGILPGSATPLAAITATDEAIQEATRLAITAAEGIAF